MNVPVTMQILTVRNLCQCRNSARSRRSGNAIRSFFAYRSGKHPMDNLETRLQRIQSKLKAGGFALNPALTEAEIQSYEQRHHIQLPEDYRLFLRDAGNGGAGPTD